MSRPSITRPFAYHTGSVIDGTNQIGDLAIGLAPYDYSKGPGELTWWNGANESEAYLIAYPQPNGLHPTQIPGVTASVGFWGDKTKTEAGFLAMIQDKLGQTFANGDDAKTWLTNNGYWTNWGPSFTLGYGDVTFNTQRYHGYTNTTDNGFTCLGDTDTYNGVIYNLSGSLPTDIASIWTGAGLNVNNAYVWNIHFTTGGNVVARVALNPDGFTNSIGICPIDPTNNTWKGGSIGTPLLAGTFEFPATFSLYTPVTQISNHNDWC